MKVFATTASIVFVLSTFVGVRTAGATIVPFTENFAANSANWYDAAGTSPLGWNSSGGPDSSSYATGGFNFATSAPGANVAILRAQDEFNSSGNAFVGNWIADGVNQLNFYVRHNAPTPLTFFARVADLDNVPGVGIVNFAPVPANTWTQITFAITPGNPQFFFEGPGSTYTSVFSSVGHVQIGVSVPASLSGVNESFTFDVDQTTIVPEPACASLLLMGLALLKRRRTVKQ